MMENYLYIMYNQINKAMQKIMRSLFIATLLLVSMGMGAYAQETKKTFTPEQQEMIDLSNAKWKARRTLPRELYVCTYGWFVG